ncbi:steroid delta-isomerase [Candidatus Kapabacteria bacterium]|nr:steroid delta-isomerase [Candidatus Kapabacteria bacterium]
MKQIITPLVFIYITLTLLSQTSKDDYMKIEEEAEKLVKQQLTAYNNRDIDKFLIPFSDSVEVYTFPNKLMYVGKDKMKLAYQDKFKELTNLNCKITERIILGNTVIDSEEVTGIIPDKILKAVAIYKIENNKIQKVYFIK